MVVKRARALAYLTAATLAACAPLAHQNPSPLADAGPLLDPTNSPFPTTSPTPGGTLQAAPCATLASQPWVCAFPTLSATRTPRLTPTPSPRPVPAPGILRDFPLGIGATWAYTVEATYIASVTSEGVLRTGYWNGTVIVKITDQDLSLGTFSYSVEVWPTPPSDVWISSGTEQYQLTSNGVLQDGTKIYQWPLEDGAAWLAWEDFTYQWHATSQPQVTTPLRTFRDCFTLSLVTGPDTTIDAFCPGVGLVARDYFHHPSPPTQRWRLMSFQAAP